MQAASPLASLDLAAEMRELCERVCVCFKIKVQSLCPVPAAASVLPSLLLLHFPFPSPHAFLHFFLLCDTAQELLLRLGTPRVPHILQQILLLQVSSLCPLPLQLHSLSKLCAATSSD